MRSPWISTLGKDPKHRKNRLNGVSYQEDALTSFNGWQYAVFYGSVTPESEEEEKEPLYVHLARRPLTAQTWEVLVFDDYPQTTDDGHNTAQLGICQGDGTIHLSYDHHCDMYVHQRFFLRLSVKIVLLAGEYLFTDRHAELENDAD